MRLTPHPLPGIPASQSTPAPKIGPGTSCEWTGGRAIAHTRGSPTMNTQFPAERILLGPGPSPVPAARAARARRADARPSRSAVSRHHGRDLRNAAAGLPHEERAHLSRQRHRHGRHGMHRHQSHRARRRSDRLRQRRLRRPHEGRDGTLRRDRPRRRGRRGATSSRSSRSPPRWTQHPKAKLVGIVHAETSTGALQPLDGLADLVHAPAARCSSSMPSPASAATNCAWTTGASTPSTAARRNA